jgi:hypothetical protein
MRQSAVSKCIFHEKPILGRGSLRCGKEAASEDEGRRAAPSFPLISILIETVRFHV